AWPTAAAGFVLLLAAAALTDAAEPSRGGGGGKPAPAGASGSPPPVQPGTPLTPPTAEDQLRVVEVQLEASKAALDLAAGSLERLHKLRDRGSVSEEEVQQAEAALARSKADVSMRSLEAERLR